MSVNVLARPQRPSLQTAPPIAYSNQGAPADHIALVAGAANMVRYTAGPILRQGSVALLRWFPGGSCRPNWRIRCWSDLTLADLIGAGCDPVLAEVAVAMAKHTNLAVSVPVLVWDDRPNEPLRFSLHQIDVVGCR